MLSVLLCQARALPRPEPLLQPTYLQLRLFWGRAGSQVLSQLCHQFTVSPHLGASAFPQSGSMSPGGPSDHSSLAGH